MAKTAEDIMTERVITTTVSATVSEVAKLLTRNAISGVPVVGEGEAAGLRTKVIGIVTEADILGKPAEAPVESLMTRTVITVKPQTPVSEIVNYLAARNIKRVPVVNDAGHLVGIVSRADVIAAMSDE